EDLPSIWDFSITEARYLVSPELPEGAVVGITGDSGCGKSTIVSHWAGIVLKTGRKVLYLDRENSAYVVQDRFKRLGIERSELLYYWGGWADEAPRPGSATVLEWVRACDPRPLVVVDSLVAFLTGNENDAVDTRRWLHQCRQIAN